MIKKAFSTKNYALVRQILNENPSFANAKDNGKPLIFSAIDDNDLQMILAIIESGGDVDKCEVTTGDTPLIYAIKGNKAKIVEILVNHKASKNKANKRGDTAQFLGANSINKNIRKYFNSDPIQYTRGDFIEAFKQNNIDRISKMLKSDIEFQTTKIDGLIAIVYASKNERFDIVKLFASMNCDINMDDAGETALHAATMKNNVEMVKLLLSLGAIDSKNYANQTALQIAEENCFFELEDILKKWHEKNDNRESRKSPSKQSPKPNYSPTKKKGSPIRMKKKGSPKKARQRLFLEAFLDNDFPTMIELIKIDQNIINIEIDGEPLLLNAVQNNNSKMVSLLLQYGADPNITNIDGISILGIAIKAEYLTIARMLINAGANTNVRIEGKKLSSFCRDPTLSPLLKRAKKEENKSCTVSELTIATGSPKHRQKEIDEVTEISVIDDQHPENIHSYVNECIELCKRDRAEELAEYLLKDPKLGRKYNEDGYSIAMTAIIFGRYDIFEMFFPISNPAHRDKFGRKLFDIAKEFQRVDYIKEYIENHPPADYN